MKRELVICGNCFTFYSVLLANVTTVGTLRVILATFLVKKTFNLKICFKTVGLFSRLLF